MCESENNLTPKVKEGGVVGSRSKISAINSTKNSSFKSNERDLEEEYCYS